MTLLLVVLTAALAAEHLLFRFVLRPKRGEFLKSGKVDYEFRTTIVKEFHSVDDIRKAADWIKGAKRYFLQNFVDSGNLIDSSVTGVDKQTMLEMQKAAAEFVPQTQIRGI